MALIHHATVTLPHKSGLARDQVQNGFTFAMETDWALADFVAAEARITNFYNATPIAGAPVASKISPCISRTIAPVIRWYAIDGHLSGTPVGSPVRVQPMALLGAPGGTTPLPAEVAIVVGWHSSYGTDVEFGPGTRPRQRDRNRIYVGPLTTNVIQIDGADSHAKVATNVMDDFGHSAQTTLMAGAGAMAFVVWSRKSAAVKNVAAITVDDAFDTQRRRGERRSLVSTYP